MTIDLKTIRTQRRSELGNSSNATMTDQMFWTDKWLNYAKKTPVHEWDGVLVGQYRTKLEKEGYAPSVVKHALSVVQRVFAAAINATEKERRRLIVEGKKDEAGSLLGPLWDIGKRWLPEVSDSDLNVPAMTFEEIEKIALAAKKGKLTPAEAFYSVMASVYGLRAGELCRIRMEHLNIEQNTIWIDTLKHGRKRDQLLAPALIPWLEKWDFSRKFNENQMNGMYHWICKQAGMERERGKAWHSFRRYLDTELRDALAGDRKLKLDYELISKIFFRWKLSSSAEMGVRYYARNPLGADSICLEHHPVLPLWE